MARGSEMARHIGLWRSQKKCQMHVSNNDYGVTLKNAPDNAKAKILRVHIRELKLDSEILIEWMFYKEFCKLPFYAPKISLFETPRLLSMDLSAKPYMKQVKRPLNLQLMA